LRCELGLDISREFEKREDVYRLVDQLILASDLIFPKEYPILDLMPAVIQSYRDSKDEQAGVLRARRSRRVRRLALAYPKKDRDFLRRRIETRKPLTPGQKRILPDCSLFQRAFYNCLRVEEIREEQALFDSLPTTQRFEVEEFETVLLKRYYKEIITQYLHYNLAMAIAGQGTYVYRFDKNHYETMLLKSGTIRRQMEPGEKRKKFNQHSDTLCKKLAERFTFNGQCLLIPTVGSRDVNKDAADIKHRFESIHCAQEKREMVKRALETLNLHLDKSMLSELNEAMSSRLADAPDAAGMCGDLPEALKLDLGPDGKDSEDNFICKDNLLLYSLIDYDKFDSWWLREVSMQGGAADRLYLPQFKIPEHLNTQLSQSSTVNYPLETAMESDKPKTSRSHQRSALYDAEREVENGIRKMRDDLARIERHRRRAATGELIIMRNGRKVEVISLSRGCRNSRPVWVSDGDHIQVYAEEGELLIPLAGYDFFLDDVDYDVEPVSFRLEGRQTISFSPSVMPEEDRSEADAKVEITYNYPQRNLFVALWDWLAGGWSFMQSHPAPSVLTLAAIVVLLYFSLLILQPKPKQEIITKTSPTPTSLGSSPSPTINNSVTEATAALSDKNILSSKDPSGLPLSDEHRILLVEAYGGKLPDTQSILLIGEKIRTAGAEEVEFKVTSPVGTAIRENRPVFKWTLRKDAASYTIYYKATGEQQSKKSPPIPASNDLQWQPAPSQALERGKDYEWYVRADLKHPDGYRISSLTILNQPNAKFRILSRDKMLEINKVLKSYPQSRLMRGLILLKEGLLDDALIEFQKLSMENPRSNIVRNILNKTQNLRTPKR